MYRYGDKRKIVRRTEKVKCTYWYGVRNTPYGTVNSHKSTLDGEGWIKEKEGFCAEGCLWAKGLQ